MTELSSEQVLRSRYHHVYAGRYRSAQTKLTTSNTRLKNDLMLKLKPSPMFQRNTMCADALLQHGLQPHQSHTMPHQSHTMPHQSHTLSHSLQPANTHSSHPLPVVMETKALPSSYHRISAEAKVALDETRHDMAVPLPEVFPDSRKPADDAKRLTPPPPPTTLSPLATPLKSLRPPSASLQPLRSPGVGGLNSQAPPTPGTSLPPLRRASYPRITLDTLPSHPIIEEMSFVITPPDYDARFAEEMDRQANIKLRGQLPPEAVQSTIYKEAVIKCQQWMNKYMD